jgi:hypothetical protein
VADDELSVLSLCGPTAAHVDGHSVQCMVGLSGM